MPSKPYLDGCTVGNRNVDLTFILAKILPTNAQIERHQRVYNLYAIILINDIVYDTAV